MHNSDSSFTCTRVSDCRFRGREAAGTGKGDKSRTRSVLRLCALWKYCSHLYMTVKRRRLLREILEISVPIMLQRRGTRTSKSRSFCFFHIPSALLAKPSGRKSMHAMVEAVKCTKLALNEQRLEHSSPIYLCFPLSLSARQAKFGHSNKRAC